MSTDPKKQLDEATTATGILAINPAGSLVRLRPGSVRLGATVDKGVFLQGLKPGWRLATKADVAAKTAAEKELDKNNPRGSASPKKAGG